MVRTWYADVREQIRTAALDAGVDVREYSATALLAIAAPFQTICAQVGDGGIVLRAAQSAGFNVAIWPEAAEYANETYFITDRTLSDHVQIKRLDGVADIIAFSDGLQRLAIEQTTRTGFAPFCEPLVSTVRESEDVDALQRDLHSYLSSQAVNNRTDDDKSLAIACRL